MHNNECTTLVNLCSSVFFTCCTHLFIFQKVTVFAFVIGVTSCPGFLGLRSFPVFSLTCSVQLGPQTQLNQFPVLGFVRDIFLKNYN
jgi:hypothetical protein